MLLKQPASQYYEHAQLYFSGQIGFDNWQSVALQGIADFAYRLNSADNLKHLHAAWPNLPVEVLQPLSAMLEHIEIPPTLSELLLSYGQTALKNNDVVTASAALRAISSGQATGLSAQLVDCALESTLGQDSDILLTIAGRSFKQLEEPQRLHVFMDNCAHHEKIAELFPSIFADLVAIATIRPHLLALLREENRSETLARAIGRLFS